MKKIVLAILLISFVAVLFADEMDYKEIQKAYKKSYDYEIMEKYDKAINVLSSVYRNYSDTYTINYRLGWLYYLNKKYANALEHLQKALNIFPSSVEVLNTIDLIYAAQQEWIKLEGNALRIIQIDYYNNYANYWYSFALKKQNKLDLAIKVDNKILAILPSSVTFLTELAENLYLLKDYKNAYTQFNNVMILDSTNQTAKYYLDLMEKAKENKKK